MDENRLLDEAKALIDSGKYDAAEAKIDRVLSINENNARAFFLKGQIRFERGEYDAACTCFKRALNINESPWPVIGLFDALNKLDRSEEQEDLCRKYGQRFPGNIPLQRRIFSFLYVQGKYDLVFDHAFKVKKQVVEDGVVAEKIIFSALSAGSSHIMRGNVLHAFSNSEALKAVLFKIDRALSIRKYAGNSEYIIEAVRGLTKDDKPFVLLTAFFSRQDFYNAARQSLINGISAWTLSDIGIIYKNIFNIVSEKELLVALANSYRWEKLDNILEMLLVIAYVKQIDIQKFVSDAELIRFASKTKNNTLKLHILNVLGVGDICHKLIYRDATVKGKSKNVTSSARRPRIALCISGQLRGYKRAWPEMKRIFIEEMGADVFVHVWKDVGFKKPTLGLGHASRSFSGNFLNAWIELGRFMSFHEIESRYYKLFDIFPTDKVKQEDIQKFYSAKACIVEDDNDAIFREKSNAEKMFYKIQSCYELASSYGEYDYFVRIRPDLLLKGSWSHEKMFIDEDILCDLPLNITPLFLCVGDQLAISSGEVMSVYSSVFSTVGIFNDLGLYGRNPQRPHEPLSWRFFMENYKVGTIEDIGIRKVGLADNNGPLKAHAIYSALKDVLKPEQHRGDKMLYEALMKDMENERESSEIDM